MDGLGRVAYEQYTQEATQKNEQTQVEETTEDKA